VTLHQISRREPHLYIDVTGLREYFLRYTVVSGIQRFSLMVIEAAVAQLGRERCSLIRYDTKSGQYLEGPPIDEFKTQDVAWIKSALGVPDAAPTLGRHAERRLEYSVKWAVRQFRASIGDSDYFSKRGSSVNEWKSYRRGDVTRVPVRYSPLRTEMVKGDKVLLLDFLYPDKSAFDWFPQFKDQGSDVVSISYDMIPARMNTVKVGARKFFQFYQDAAPHVCNYLVVSQASAFDLHEYLKANGIDRPSKVVPLARQRITLPKDAVAVDNVAGLESGSFVLCLGAIDARKNVLGVLKAWQDLLKRGAKVPPLVFAGRSSAWHNKAFFDLLSATDNLGGMVKVIESPSDSQVDWLYRNSLFTAVLSFYEGWGLPVGESIAYGKTAVVSNISSLPEVGEDLVLYADPHDQDSITQALERMLTEPGLRESLEAKIATRKLRTWEDVARDMVAAAFGRETLVDPAEAESVPAKIAHVA
jgi:glycosyltransferase involved in cell wall biosynthesis